MTWVTPVRLEALAKSLLVAAGASESNAACVAESLVSANLAGHDSHGVQKLPSYVRDIRAGSLEPSALPHITRESVTTAVVDGMGTFGHVAASFSVEIAIRKTRETGMASVSTTRCHHTGRIGRWVEKIADAGFVGIMMGAEAQPPYKVAPFGGKEGALATNPIAVAVPRGAAAPPILLDYATSVVSIGKLQALSARGEALPHGWFLDASGNPTNVADDFFDGGVLLPFGGYKGYALGVVAELLAVGLSSGDRVPIGQRASSLFTLALDPAAFRPADEFDASVRSTASRLKETRCADAVADVLLPGEPETLSRESRAHAIPVPDATWQALMDLGAQLDLDAAAFTSDEQRRA